MPEPWEVMAGRRSRRQRPISRDPIELGVSVGEVFSRSFKTGQQEGLYNSWARAAEMDKKLIEMGVDESMPTGIRSLDIARGIRPGGNLRQTFAELPLSRTGRAEYINIDQAKEIADARDPSLWEDVSRDLTARIRPDLGDTVSKFAFESALDRIERARKVNRRIARGTESLWGKTAMLSGGLIGSFTDPGDLAMSILPVGRAARATSHARRMGNMLRRAETIGARFRRYGEVSLRSFARAEDEWARSLSKVGFVKRTSMRAREGMVDGFGGALAAEPFILANNIAAGSDYSVEDSTLNVLFGAIMGSGLHAGFGAISDAMGGRWGPDGELIEAPKKSFGEAAATAQPDGMIPRNVNSWDPKVKVEMFSIATTDALYGRRLDMDNAAALFGIGPDGRRLSVAPTMSEGSVSFRGKDLGTIESLVNRLWKWDDNHWTAQGRLREFTESLAEIGIPHDVALRMYNDPSGDKGLSVLREYLAKGTRDQVDRARALLRAQGKDDKLESLSEFLGRTSDSKESRLDRAIAEGFLPDGSSKSDLDSLVKRDLTGDPVYRESDMQVVRGAIKQLEEMDSAIRGVGTTEGFRPELANVDWDANKGAAMGRFNTKQDLRNWFHEKFDVRKSMDYDEVAVQSTEAAAKVESSMPEDLVRMKNDVDQLKETVKMSLDEKSAQELADAIAVIDADFKKRSEMRGMAISCLYGGGA